MKIVGTEITVVMVAVGMMVTKNDDGDNWRRQWGWGKQFDAAAANSPLSQLTPNRDLRSIMVRIFGWTFPLLEFGRRTIYLFMYLFFVCFCPLLCPMKSLEFSRSFWLNSFGLNRSVGSRGNFSRNNAQQAHGMARILNQKFGAILPRNLTYLKLKFTLHLFSFSGAALPDKSK